MTVIDEEPQILRPWAFTAKELGWVPWLEPPAADELSPEQVASLVQRQRAASPYFRLLSEDPAALEARTRADLDIFHAAGGLPRAERELAAAAVSRVNGCVFCASVHARFAGQISHRPDAVATLLEEGVGADLGERWNAVVEASAALTATPVAFGPTHVARLRAAGLGALEISDLLHAAAFFSWANRLMLSLGEPEVPQG
ncbi:MAG: alkylhydroperoxidase domain protein [Propioniciclava sp.]